MRVVEVEVVTILPLAQAEPEVVLTVEQALPILAETGPLTSVEAVAVAVTVLVLPQATEGTVGQESSSSDIPIRKLMLLVVLKRPVEPSESTRSTAQALSR